MDLKSNDKDLEWKGKRDKGDTGEGHTKTEVDWGDIPASQRMTGIASSYQKLGKRQGMILRASRGTHLLTLCRLLAFTVVRE